MLRCMSRVRCLYGTNIRRVVVPGVDVCVYVFKSTVETVEMSMAEQGLFVKKGIIKS